MERAIVVTRELCEASPGPAKCVSRDQNYVGTGRIELYLTRLGADPRDFWRSNAYRYLIDTT